VIYVLGLIAGPMLGFFAAAIGIIIAASEQKPKPTAL
jgi:hypothetical protein